MATRMDKQAKKKGDGVPLAKASGRSTPAAGEDAERQATPSREYTLKLDLSQDEYYSDNYAIFLQTHEHSATRIAGEKQSGAWKTIRRWTVRITDADLAEASDFASGIATKNPQRGSARIRSGKPGASSSKR